jgi:hypothetical protein
MSSSADKPVRHILSISGGKAASYFRAFDMLDPILTRHYPKPIVGGSVWHSFSFADIHDFSRSGTRLSMNFQTGVRDAKML